MQAQVQTLEESKTEINRAHTDLTSPRVYLKDELKLNLKQVIPGTKLQGNNWLTPRGLADIKVGKLKPLRVNHHIMSRNLHPEVTSSVTPMKLKFNMPDPKLVLKSK